MIWFVPTLKNVFGASDLVTNIATPDTSVAVGSIHEITRPGTPNSTTLSIRSGQSIIVGGIVSTVEINEKQIC